MGGLPGVWFDKLTRNAGCGRVVGCCWVPAPDRVPRIASGAGWGRLCAGMTGARRAGGGGERGLGCVQWVGVMCSVFGPMCSLSGRMCSLWRGRCSVFGGGRWLGIGDGGMTGMCPLCQANVSSFWADVFSFEGDVSTLARNVSSCRRGALVGDGARTEGEIPPSASSGQASAGSGQAPSAGLP